jgi:PAS domain S-box-containing protein
LDARGESVTNEESAARAAATWRARARSLHSRATPLVGPRTIAAGAIIGLAAITAKVALGGVAGGDTGYILLVAAVILAAWIGGVAAGLAATICCLILNSIVFVRAGTDLVAPDSLEAWKQVLFLVTGSVSTVIVASTRASRDSLVAALDEVSTMAGAIESRDQRLEIMLAASGTGFWEWDIVTGDLQWSDAIFRQHGMEPSDRAPAFPVYMGMIHEDDRDPFDSAIQLALDGGGDFDLEFRLVWPDGTEHWTRGSGRVFRDEMNQPVRMLGTGQDITEQKSLESERDSLLREERRAGEFREAFIDVISHELRTPITTILGATEILSRPGRVTDPDVRMAILADARAESERLYRLVEDLLVLSRVERGRLVVESEPLQPRRLLERVTTQMATELPAVNISLEAPDSLPVVSGEATYVEQIMRNLLENAAKYSPVGTDVVVSAKHVGSEVAVSVLDGGPGIPAASLDHIFDLFYRDPAMARTVAGSGIGLFVCRNLAEAMGGRMDVAPGPDKGAMFTFSLPVLAGDEGDLARVPAR